MPRVNMLLLAGVLLLVALFRSSSSLASRYGIAVTGTMVVTAMMAFLVIWKTWKWSPWAAGALIAPFLLIDLTFLGANLLKVLEGGYMPLALGGLVMLLMYTWRRGSRLLFDKTRKQETPLRGLVAMLEKKPPVHVRARRCSSQRPDQRTDRTDAQSQALQGAAREERHPELETRHSDGEAGRAGPDRADRRELLLRDAAFRLHGDAEVPKALAIARKLGWAVRHHVDLVLPVAAFAQARGAFRHAALQDRLFIRLAQSANDATDYFQIPTGRVVEIGTQVAI